MGASAKFKNSNKNILIVENEINWQNDLRKKSEQLGYNVIGVEVNLKGALASIRKNVPDLILIDIFLDKDEDGIKSSEILKTKLDIPIIFVSEKLDKETISCAAKALPAAFLFLPVDINQLFYAFEAALYKYAKEKRDTIQQYELRMLSDSDDDLILKTAFAYSDEEENVTPFQTGYPHNDAYQFINADLEAEKKIREAVTLRRGIDPSKISSASIDKLYRKILGYAARLEGVDTGCVFLLSKNNVLELKGSFGFRNGFSKKTSLDPLKFPGLKKIMRGVPVYIKDDDMFLESMKATSGKRMKILAAVPLKEESRVIGALCVGSAFFSEFSNSQKKMIETFALQAGIYLSRMIAGEELKISEEKYRKFFETDITGIFKTTRDGKILDCNPAFVQMLEFDSKSAVLKSNIIDIYANLTDRKKLYRKLLKEKKLILVELELKTVKGNIIRVIENMIGDYDEKNKLVGATSFIFDITKIRSAEKALKRSEKRYRELFERMQDGFVLFELITSQDGRPKDYKFLTVNPAFEKMTGIKLENTIGKTINEVISDIDASWTAEFEKAVIQGKPARFEKYSNKLRKYFRVLIYFPEESQVAIILEDITDYKKNEEKITQLSVAVEQSPVTILITDLNGSIEYANNKFTELTGYSRDEIIGKNPSILKSGYTKKEDYERMWKTIRSGKSWHGFFYNKKKNGELFWEAANISALRDSTGKITHFLAVKEDITERVVVETELEMHRNKLEELVAQRTKELDETNKKLKGEIEKEKEIERMLKQSLEKEKELSELKTRFISTTSHEFRTPLTSVLASSELIQRYGRKWSEEKFNHHTSKIKASIEYMTKLLDDVLTINRTESGKIWFNPIMMNLKLACNEMIEEVKSYSNKNHKFRFTYSVNRNSLMLDPKLIRFIIVNLLSNAFKYSPDGGKVELKISYKKSDLIIIVKDEGIGIPPNDIPYLFEPFHRGENTIEIPGTGLGLSIVKKAVDLHNGKIKFESAEDRGSIFTIVLPTENKEAI